jgi:hypothetical protein
VATFPDIVARGRAGRGRISAYTGRVIDFAVHGSKKQEMSTTTSGPNPLCEVGMRHPRDRHRMRPVEGADQVWYCSRHGMYAQLVDTEAAEEAKRGDAWTQHPDVTGVVVGLGDERQGGRIVYFREQ